MKRSVLFFWLQGKLDVLWPWARDPGLAEHLQLFLNRLPTSTPVPGETVNTFSGLRWRGESRAVQVLFCVLLFYSDQEETNRSQGLTTHGSGRGMQAVKELFLCPLEPFFKPRVRCRVAITDKER